jgi:hypothetical protein
VKTRSAGAGIGLHTKEDLEAFICGAIQVRSATEVNVIPVALNTKRNAFWRLFLLSDYLMQDFCIHPLTMKIWEIIFGLPLPVN